VDTQLRRRAARRLRRRINRCGDTWHLGELFCNVNGEVVYLWRGVDQDGDTLDVLVQKWRSAKPAQRFFQRLSKGLRYSPSVIVTDKISFIIDGRDSSGGTCAYRVFVDGKPIALIRNGERVDVYIEPGDHVLGVRTDGFCGGGTAETGAQLSNGQWKRYRISSGQDGTLQLSPTAFWLRC